MAKSKLRRLLVSQNRSLGLGGVDLGSVQGDSRQVLGGQGRAPEKFRGRFVFFISGQKKYEHLSKNSFPSGSAETGAE